MNHEPCRHTAFLSLGSNIGNRLANLSKAIDQLREKTTVKQISSVYETAPVGNIGQSDFLNLVLELETISSPQALMQLLLEIESRLGRRRTEKWGPRIIDMDIIFFDDAVIQEKDLSIPHAHYTERNFVLVPLVEIADDFICPVRKISVKEILENSRDRRTVRLSADAVFI